MNIEKRFNLAKRHKNYRKEVLEKLGKQSESEIESISTYEARQAYNWNKQVAACYQRSRAFIRLKISRYGIVYGRLEPEHFVEDMVAEWLVSRFPKLAVMIESFRGTFVVSKEKPLTVYREKIEELLPMLEKSLPEDAILKKLEEFNDEDYWENYYDSQFIKTRKNRKYFLHNIPKKFHNWDGLRLEKERFSGNRKLKDYLPKH
ncbi:DUF4130 domain-containing protein [Candidatus Woesearchaeota archaeon]|nr:DUF4130 domain-containing protein [Candidatus Woesearchaeota archaeon]